MNSDDDVRQKTGSTHGMNDIPYSKYRKRALEVYDEKCRNCGNGEVVIHHIDGDRSNHDLNNLMPLCDSCHGRIHIENGNVDGLLKELQSKLPDGSIGGSSHIKYEQASMFKEDKQKLEELTHTDIPMATKLSKAVDALEREQ